MSADMDATTRRKHFADYLVTNRRYTQAIAEYERVLEEIPSMNHVMRSELFHNKGVAFCRLFSFEEAAKAFQAAYQENPDNQEAGIRYLAALRMSLSEGEYITFIANEPVWHEMSLEVERLMEEQKRDYESSGEYRELIGILSQHDAEYYEMISGKLLGMRRKYREMVAQP